MTSSRKTSDVLPLHLRALDKFLIVFPKTTRPLYLTSAFTALICLLLLLPSTSAQECPESCTCTKSFQELLCKSGQLLNIFTQLDPQLKKLILIDVNGLQTIQKARIRDMTGGEELVKLEICHSFVREIESKAFESLPKLRELDLSMNELMTIQDDTFSGLTELRNLNLSHNKLSILGLSLQPLSNLITFDVSVNHLKGFAKDAFSSQALLTRMKLDGNPLKKLDAHSFPGLDSLRDFGARDCSLAEIDGEVFSSMPKLAVIDLGQNRLSDVPPLFVLSKLMFLKALFFDHNEIQELKEEHFARLHLQTIDLSYNRINQMDLLAFKGASVSELDLSYNLIISLNRKTLAPLAHHVSSLNLAGNPIRELEADVFADLELLKTLNLSSCSLQTLKNNVLNDLPVLRRLDISHNNLHFLPEPVLNQMDKLYMVDMHDNPWVCDCHIKHLRDWLKKASSAAKLQCLPDHTEHPDCFNLHCEAPSILHTKKVSLLKDTELAACESDSQSGLPASTQGAIVASCMGFAIVLLIITIFLWKRGKTKHGLKRVCVPSEAESSHIVDEDTKISPLENCDRNSLTLSDHNFVFRHYFDHLVTDPKLMAGDDEEEEEDDDAVGHRERDSLYSSQPSLYSNSNHNAVYGVESTV